MAPVRANIASRSVVLPLWNGPTSAMHRGPRGLLTSCPIAASFFWSSALDWVGGYDAPPTLAIWQDGKTSLRCGVTTAYRLSCHCEGDYPGVDFNGRSFYSALRQGGIAIVVLGFLNVIPIARAGHGRDSTVPGLHSLAVGSDLESVARNFTDDTCKVGLPEP